MGLDAALHLPPTGDRPRFDAASGALVGTRCASCGASAWPGRAVCHRCGNADLEARAFVGAAQLLSYTEVMVPRPGIEVPYVLGQVRLNDGPVVFGRVAGLREQVDVPCPVRARFGRDVDGAPQYWFEAE